MTKQPISPCNVKVTDADLAQATLILADDNNYAVRYLRQAPTVGLATVPVRNKDGEIITDMDWVRKRVICAGVPYACMIAFKYQDALRIGWSKRIEEKALVETPDLHNLFQGVLKSTEDTAKDFDSDGYKSAFDAFCGQLMSVLSYSPAKDIELSFSKNSGKTTAIIRGLNDTICIRDSGFVESAASGPIPHDITKNLRWFIDYAERTYGGKAANVEYLFSPLVKADNILPVTV
jgi:hypothetical protein